jgi:ureidoglycolate lyase
MNDHPIALEPFSADAFLPFGWPVAMGACAPVFQAEHIRSWDIAFEVDDELRLMLAWYAQLPLRLHLIERHTAVTQAFMPLGDFPSVMVVASGRPDAVPEPDALRAFLVPPFTGIVLRRNAWHALTRFPIGSAGGAFALLTSAATQAELEAQAGGGPLPELTRVIDYRPQGLAFEVTDPRGLLVPASGLGGLYIEG